MNISQKHAAVRYAKLLFQYVCAYTYTIGPTRQQFLLVLPDEERQGRGIVE